MAGMVVLVALVALIGIGARYGVVSPQGRLFIEARTDGLKLGRIGRLKIEGLTGDVWDAFAVRRLTISDEQGVWLDARNIAIDWDYAPLFRRRFYAESIKAEIVQVLRRPTLTPKTKSGGLPVSFDIDLLQARLETLPAVSVEHGDFDVEAGFEIERDGGGEGVVSVASRLRQGDGLKGDFKYGRDEVFIVNLDAVEAQGGPLAGTVGLSADRPFQLTARVNGTRPQGSVLIVAKTGDQTPLDVKGSWGATGMAASGKMALGASSLLTRAVEMLGPEAEFTASGRQSAEAGVFDFALDMKTDNLTLKASGPFRASDRATPTGITVDARVNDLTRIVAAPAMGSGHVTGQLTGKLDDFHLKGQAVVEKFELAGYGLTRVQGPVDLRLANRELTLKASAAGAGGRGSGALAAWLGGNPTAAVELARLRDGRLLIRSLSGKGVGLQVAGKGSTTLLGGLSFDGDLELSNLAQARAGASGRLNAKWSASRSRNAPWAFTADANGRDFATGMAELDRLLGPTPRLQARAAMQNGAWSFERANLSGTAGDVSAAGIFGPNNTLKFTLDWRAQGPFSAGPVEIAGKIEGDGALVGTISEPRADLKARVDQIDLGPLDLTNANLALTFARGASGTDGQFSITSGSNYGPASAATRFAFSDGGIDLSGIDAKAAGLTAAGSLTLRGRSPSRADLTLALAPGAFIDKGEANARVQVVDAPGGATGNISLTAKGLGFKDNPLIIRSASLTANGPMTRMPYTLKADVVRGDMPIVAEGSGVAAEAGEGYTVSFNGRGRVREIEMRTLEPLNVAFGGPALSATGALSVGGGRADINASQRGEQVDVKAVLAGVDVSVLSPDLKGRVNGQLTASGRGQALTGSMEARLDDLRTTDGPDNLALDAMVRADLAETRLTVNAEATGAGGLRSSANLVLPAETSAAPFRVAINRTRPMQGAFDIDGEVQPIWNLFFGGARTLGGRATAKGTIAGTLNDPRITGQAELANGQLEDFATGLKLRNVALAAALNNEAVTITRFTGQDGGNGTLNGEGRVSLTPGGASTFTLNVASFLVIDNEIADAEATGRVTVTRGADGKATLSGKLTIDRADIVPEPPRGGGVAPLDVIEINIPESRADVFVAPRARGPAIALDVELDAPRRIFVRGRGLDAELSLNAKVSGTTAAPVLSGEARVVRGEYEFAGKRFEFDNSSVVYLAASADRIRLNLTAARIDPTLTAVIQVRGTAAKPEITLTSRPVLPQDEVLAQVLFGRSASQLTPVEAAQLAMSVSALAGGGGFDVIGGLRGLAGLDRLSFGGGDEAGGLTISGGKYITDDVYLELTGGGRDGAAVQVEWRVRRSLAIVSRVAQTGDTKLAVRWRRESGKPPPPK